ncbi:MAG TPA: hypothetical protein VHN11_20970 [Xanthobacteraceae bacterium]|nr:hypothetical protein [Xanthobacteraceae bacterium]
MAGDVKNFMAASTVGGIEAQEKAGQLEQAEKQTLPLDLGQRYGGSADEARKPWEKLGFKFGKKVDDIFVEATFPNGWKKRPTDHSMWSEIVDEKGRKRGAIFYKAAFYDRSANAYLERRFSVRETYEGPKLIQIVDACGEVKREIAGDDTSNLQGDAFHVAYEGNRAKASELAAWLSANYPDWQNPTAYWS